MEHRKERIKKKSEGRTKMEVSVRRRKTQERWRVLERKRKKQKK